MEDIMAVVQRIILVEKQEPAREGKTQRVY
jgi:hypothetical protein